MAEALLLAPRPSPRLAAAAGGLTFAALAALLLSGLSPWIQAPLALAVGLSGLHLALSHGLRRGPWALRRVEWGADGGWRLVTGRGERLEARLLDGGLVHPALLILPFATGRWRRRSLLLAVDGEAAETLRRLRARLLLPERP